MPGGNHSQSEPIQFNPAGGRVDDADSDKTVAHQSDTAERASDVVLAESETSKHVSDVVLAESATLRAPSFPSPTPPGSAPPQAGSTIELRPDENRAAHTKTPMALLPGAKVDDFE